MRWRRRRSEQDFEEEIRSHIAHEWDRLIATGVAPDEARVLAERAFGDMTVALSRFGTTQPAPWLENAWRDVVLALRTLRREPGFTVVSVLTLALGLGLNTAVFTLLYGVTVRQLPLRDAHRVVTAHQQFGAFEAVGATMHGAHMQHEEFRRDIHGALDMMSYEEYEAYRDRATTLEGLAAFAWVELTLDGEPPRPVRGLLASCDYFGLLQARMAIGRGFTTDECARPGSAPVVVLSHTVWRSRFGGDAGLMGRTIVLNRQPFTVIGVAEEGFVGTELRRPAMWIPLTMQPALEADRLARSNLSWLRLVGRLSPGRTAEAAAAELTRIGRSFDAEYRGRNGSVAVYRATPMTGPEVRQRGVWMALASLVSAGLVVLMACLNIMNLLLARAPSRRRGVRIRLALGAGQRRILRQLLTESVLLALLGGAVGLVLAWSASGLLIARLPMGGLMPDLSLDLRVFCYAFVACVGAAALFGTAPALEATRVDLASALRGDSAAAGLGARISRLRHAVVAAQLAGSVLLLVLAALFLRSVLQARSVSPGYAVDEIHAYRPRLSELGYGRAEGVAFYNEFRARVAALPSVDTAAFALRLPLGSRSVAVFSRPGRAEDGARRPRANYNSVSAGYFETMDIPILRGRAFTAADEQAHDPVPAVLGEAMANRFWPGEDPLAQRFRVGEREYVVVGIARDARNLTLAEADRDFFYGAVQLDPQLPRAGSDTSGAGAPPGLTLIVRTRAGSASAGAVRAVARDLDAGVVVTAQSLADEIADDVQGPTLAALLAAVLGLFATVLAVVGVYGVVAYAASQRTREIGVRLALGAERRDILVLVLRQGAPAVVSGLFVGMLLAGASATVVRSQLFGLSPLDPIAFGGAIALLGGAALFAMYRPARRAARLDPATTLRLD